LSDNKFLESESSSLSTHEILPGLINNSNKNASSKDDHIIQVKDLC